MKQITKTFRMAQSPMEIEAAMSGHKDLGGAIPTKRLKPSKHQAPTGIKPKDPEVL